VAVFKTPQHFGTLTANLIHTNISFFLKLWFFSAVTLPEKLTDLDLTHSIMKTIAE